MSTETAMTFDYARVTTADQDEALQLDALEQAGCDRVFTDHPQVRPVVDQRSMNYSGWHGGMTRSSSRASTGSGAPCVTCSRWSMTSSSRANPSGKSAGCIGRDLVAGSGNFFSRCRSCWAMTLS